ncbi:MAG: glycosyltransferase family 2 protein [Candidatus Dadabacteria bacterium]|nr:glycosyltransferase family 2 protein [Candidatus Dadabacteria bacterium]
MTKTLQNKIPVSIVMPVYNEEGILGKTLREHHSEIIEKLPGSEIVIVDDCSTDSSPQILVELEKELKSLRVIKLPHNVGHGKALRHGFENVKHDLIFHTDSDYQYNPKDFWKLYNEIDDNDLVIGYRAQRHDPIHRLIITRLLRLINTTVFGFNIKDANSPFKLIRSECLTECLKLIDKDAFAPSILLVLTAKWKKFRVKELPVEHFERTTGRVSIGSLKIIKPCLTTVYQILELKKKLNQ